MAENLTYPKGSAEYIYRLNKIKIINLIREADEISRTEIVQKTQISAPTVTRIVNDLIEKDKLVKQVGIGISSGGRPPVIVKFDGNNNFVIGIDWGRTHIYGILTNLNAETLVEKDVQTESNHDFDTDLVKVLELIRNLIDLSKIDTNKLLGIGVACAGFINRKKKIIEFSPNFKWSNINVAEPIQVKFQVPVVVDNVSRVMALGELWYGIGKQIKDFAFVNIGYGIGAGIIMNGLPFYGFDGFSGEIGHMKILSREKQNIQCVCGKFDCLECYSSGRGIAQIAENEVTMHPQSALFAYYISKVKLTTKIISEEAEKGDNFAISIMHRASETLGIALSGLANILNPEAIILGGKVIQPDTIFFNNVCNTFHREVIQQTNRKISVYSSSLYKYAAVKGAVSLILEKVLNFDVSTNE